MWELIKYLIETSVSLGLILIVNPPPDPGAILSLTTLDVSLFSYVNSVILKFLKIVIDPSSLVFDSKHWLLLVSGLTMLQPLTVIFHLATSVDAWPVISDLYLL